MTLPSQAWVFISLGECTELLTGFPFKSVQYTTAGKDIRLLRGDNIGQGFLKWENAKRWNRAEYNDYSKYHLKKNDVVLAMDRPWIPAGLKYSWIKEHDLPVLLVQRVSRLRGKNGLTTEFLRYIIGDKSFTDHVLSIITGVNIPHISPTDVKSFRFKLPPLPTQRRIASILSAYDDLIENNTRRIAILEEMARRLYEEWFVHFRFPGHETAQFVETELGLLPEGWKIKTVAELFEIIGGGTPSKKEAAYWNDGDINWYSPSDLTRSKTMFATTSSRKIAKLGLQKSSARLFPAYSVMLTSRATIGVIAINTTEACTNQGFITCLPNKRFPLSYLFHWLNENVELFISLGTGATFKEITKGTFKAIQVILPQEKILENFSAVADPIMKNILVLENQNANLRAQRDLLLPKLISGELDVSEAEETLEGAAG